MGSYIRIKRRMRQIPIDLSLQLVCSGRKAPVALQPLKDGDLPSSVIILTGSAFLEVELAKFLCCFFVEAANCRRTARADIGPAVRSMLRPRSSGEVVARTREATSQSSLRYISGGDTPELSRVLLYHWYRYP